MLSSKLCVDAVVKRSHNVFSARLKEKGPILSFWMERGLIDWIQGQPAKDAYKLFHNEFQLLTYEPRYRTTNAVLEGFKLRGSFPDERVKLVVILSEKKGWYVFRLVNSSGTILLDMEVRFEEARNIFDPIYYYYVT